MGIKNLIKMTPEQKQIAIAEFDGWKECRYVEGLKDVLGIPPKTWKGDCISGLNEAWVPPYLTSRDAICGAVGKLNNMEFCYFVEHLERTCGTDGWEIMGPKDRRRVLLATPAQMTDALLLTLGHEI